MAVEARQPLGDLLEVAERYPDAIETLGAYLRWRSEQMKGARRG